MEVYLISFLIFVAASLGMAVGIIAGRRPIRAGCGNNGVPDSASSRAEAGCEICGDLCEGDQFLAPGAPAPFGADASGTGKKEAS